MHKYIHTKYEGRMAGLREREDKDRQKTVVIPCFEKLDGTQGLWGHQIDLAGKQMEE